MGALALASCTVLLGSTVGLRVGPSSSSKQWWQFEREQCNATGARFSEPWQLDLRDLRVRLQPAQLQEHLKTVLIAAERGSVPVVLRGARDVLQSKGFSLLQQLCATPELPLIDALRAFEPGLDRWGQMREAFVSDVIRLLELLPERVEVDSASIAHFVRLATEHAEELEAANLSSITMSAMFPELHCSKLARRLHRSFPPPYYHFMKSWRQGKHYVFVSPAHSRMGVHVDAGGSYFFIRMHRGRKVVRLWPIYSRTSPEGLPPPATGRNELDSWLRAQNAWGAAVDPLVKFMGCQDFSEAEHPCEVYLPEKWGNGSWAAASAAAGEGPERRLGHGRDAQVCFVELELLPGDELFVPSDTPHQVSTLEPTLSSSMNFFPS